MNFGWIYKDAEVIEVPSLTAVVQPEGGWYVPWIPEGVQRSSERACSGQNNWLLFLTMNA